MQYPRTRVIIIREKQIMPTDPDPIRFVRRVINESIINGGHTIVLTNPSSRVRQELFRRCDGMEYDGPTPIPVKYAGDFQGESWTVEISLVDDDLQFNRFKKKIY